MFELGLVNENRIEEEEDDQRCSFEIAGHGEEAKLEAHHFVHLRLFHAFLRLSSCFRSSSFFLLSPFSSQYSKFLYSFSLTYTFIFCIRVLSIRWYALALCYVVAKIDYWAMLLAVVKIGKMLWYKYCLQSWDNLSYSLFVIYYLN